MQDQNYQPMNPDLWQGRRDRESDVAAFRWHQWVAPLDLSNPAPAPGEGGKALAILGFCCDQGVARNQGRVGAADGPAAIRRRLAGLPWTAGEDVRLYDAGDILVQHISLEEGQELLAQAVATLRRRGLLPIVLGGGHEVAWGHYRGLATALNAGGRVPHIGVLNLDAPLDLRPYPTGGTSGTMFRQIYDWCQAQGWPYAYFCLGAQPQGNTLALRRDAQSMGASYLWASQLSQGSRAEWLSQVQDFIQAADQLYLTVCMDVFSRGVAPGVSAPQALGLDPQLLLPVLAQAAASGKLVGMDIAEVAPPWDGDQATASLAAELLYNLVEAWTPSQGGQSREGAAEAALPIRMEG